MIQELEDNPHVLKLRDLNLFTLSKRRLRGDVITLCNDYTWKKCLTVRGFSTLLKRHKKIQCLETEAKEIHVKTGKDISTVILIKCSM